jgi:hypothetical protein
MSDVLRLNLKIMCDDKGFSKLQTEDVLALYDEYKDTRPAILKWTDYIWDNMQKQKPAKTCPK